MGLPAHRVCIHIDPGFNRRLAFEEYFSGDVSCRQAGNEKHRKA